MKPDLAKYANMKICVALSGGKDSMALAHYLLAHGAEYGITLSALNCDHGIRGESSVRDSAFVRQWCFSHGIPLLFFKWESSEPKTEVNARRWRVYDCYARAQLPSSEWNDGVRAEICTNDGEWQGADAVATAHHLNDNAETVLFNLARGSALSGVTGIRDSVYGSDNRVIHPLISCTREEIDDYISENGVPYVEDETNFTDGYTRNKIRHNVLPELEKAVPGAAKSIYRFSRLAADDEEYFDRLIADLKLVKRTPLGAEVKLCGERVVFKRAVLKALCGCGEVKDYTSEHAERLYSLQFAQNGKKFEFLNFVAFKEEGQISLCHKSLLAEADEGRPFAVHFAENFNLYKEQFLRIVEEEELGNALEQIRLNSFGDKTPVKAKVLKFDSDKIPESAVIRFMKTGDKFTKYGGGTKSLGDFFTDRKIPVRIRKNIPLIADGSEILAVCGVEISDKIKITSKTENIRFIVCSDYTSSIV